MRLCPIRRELDCLFKSRNRFSRFAALHLCAPQVEPRLCSSEDLPNERLSMKISPLWLRGLFLLISPIIGLAQTPQPLHHHALNADGSAKLVVTIDGSKTPDLISDAVAYFPYLSTVSVSVAKNPAEVARQKRILSHVGLSDSDLAVLMIVVAEFRSKLDPIQAEHSAVVAPTPERFDQLRAATDALVADTQAKLQWRLSAAGFSILQHYLATEIKPHMLIYEGVMEAKK